MEEKALVWIPITLRNILKHRAVENRSTIEKELIKLIEPELQKEKKSELLKREKVNANI